MLGVPISLRWFIACCIFGCHCMAACSLADDCGFLSKEVQIADRIQSITIGDFNNASRPDIAVRTSEDLSVLLNTNGGNFSSPIKTPLRYAYALGVLQTMAADNLRLLLTSTVTAALKPPGASLRGHRSTIGTLPRPVLPRRCRPQ